ncbi:MAG: ATP-binding protein, partial [Pseudomonadota bacterium]
GRPLNEPNGTLSGVLTIAVDRTDSARLRKERTQFVSAIHESQKVEALNNFAGSLAHELSNILHPAGVYARQLSAHPDHPRRKEFAAKISHAALGAGRILRRTLSMAHTDHKSVEACNLVDIVNETLETAQDLAPKALSYQFNVDPEGPAYAKAQPGELRQVLLNLLNNAAEAMCYTGQISIDLTQGHEEPAWPDIIPSGTSPFARISIKDEGPGMESSIRQRIFEPFFTTKSAGRGTGLGLPVVQGLVTGWGGVVSVDTTIGQGTTFHVWIPQPNVTE